MQKLFFLASLTSAPRALVSMTLKIIKFILFLGGGGVVCCTAVVLFMLRGGDLDYLEVCLNIKSDFLIK
jgi:hypothetical protein